MARLLMFAGVVSFALSAQVVFAQARLSPYRAAHCRSGDGREPRARFSMLETLVNINSGTMNLEGVTRGWRGDAISSSEPLGFEVRWVPMARGETRRASRWPEHKGSGRGKRLLLIGHMDTVFEKDSPFQKYERQGDKAVGPGVNDMKDGLAIMVSALRAMKTAGTLKDATVTIVLSGDEESTGKPTSVSRADMINAATRSDVALEFESLTQEDGHDMGSIARRSSTSWTVRTSAKSGHSSGVFSDAAGFGANYELTRILDAFRQTLREPNATYNVGLILGGATAELNDIGAGGEATGKSNVIAATALARGDLRTLSNEQTQRIMQRMREIVSQHLPGTKAEITFDEGYPAMPPTEGSRALLGRLNEINASAGPRTDEGAGSAEARRWRHRFRGGQSGWTNRLRCGRPGSHAPGETVDLTSFDRQIKRTALLITRLSRERK